MSAAIGCPSCGAHDPDPEARCSSCGAVIEAVPFESVAALFAAIRGRESILESRMFLFLCFLGLSPLVLASLSRSEAIVDALAIWTGLCWGVLLFRLFAPPALGIRTALAVLVGTAFLVGPLFDAYLKLWPASETWFESPSLVLRLIAYVGNVGVREELFKAGLLSFALWWHPDLRRPRAGVVLGMMAGVGFAASENVAYVYSTIADAIERSNEVNPTALLVPVYNNLIRTVVGPFAHASFSGVMGSFLALAIAQGSFRIAVSGLALAATLHGTYDTVVGFSGLLGVVVLGVSLFLAMVLHAGLQEGTGVAERGQGIFSRTMMRPVSEPTSVTPTNRPAMIPGPVSRPSVPARVAAPRPPRLADPAAPFAWAIRDGAGALYPVPMYVPLKVGRDSTACHVIVDDPSVSRIHATIGITGGRLEAVRISRIGGMKVGGRDVESALVKDGDQILIGGVVLTVVAGSRPA